MITSIKARAGLAPSLALAIVITLTGLATPAANAAGLMTPVGQSAPLSIRDHNVRVVIDDGYVVTEVEQVFSNAGGQDTEAIYTFPVPAHGAVVEFTYWIDGQPVTGEVMRREKAREIYESEKTAGRETAIAEKDEYRDFEISVYPVRGGQDVRTRLVYLQTAHTDTGIGRFVYPLEEGGVDEQRDAFWEVADTVTGSFSFTMDLKSSYPVDAVRLPGQPGATTTQLTPGHWRIELGSVGSSDTSPSQPQAATDFDLRVALLQHASAVAAPLMQEAVRTVANRVGGIGDGLVQALGGDWLGQVETGIASGSQSAATAPAAVARLNTDVVVYWRHQKGLPGAVDLVTYKPAASGTGTFMLTLTPGDDLPAITEGRDWVFILDNSGSMAGKYATLTDGVEQALGQLRPEDRFRIVTFNNRAQEITPGFVAATRAGVDTHVGRVRQLGTGGGTNLYAGIKLGIDALDSDRSSGLVLVTDGVANVGVTQKKEFLKLLGSRDVRLYTMMMGNSSNKPLLEEMTAVSNGFAMAVSNRDDISGVLRLATSKLTHAAMHNVRIKIDGVKTFDIQPDAIGSVYRGQQLVLMGHYKGGGDAEVTLTADVAGAPVHYRTRFEFPVQGGDSPELERLWAYRSIEHMQAGLDYYGADADTEEGITDLAIEYGLVTDYTSMLVVREEMFEALSITRDNRSRVELERKMRERRAANAPISRRVDRRQPMFKSPQPSPRRGSGGGAFSPLILLLLTAVALNARRRRRDHPDGLG